MATSGPELANQALADELRPAPPSSRSRLRWPRLTPERALAVLSPLALLVLWQIASDNSLVDPRILPPPTHVISTTVHLIAHGGILTDMRYTILRFLVGLALGTIPGALIGITMGLFRWPRATIRPLIQSLYPLPPIALFPIVLILVGLNETSNVIMIAIGPFFTMTITVAAAVRNIDPIYLQVAESFETGKLDLYRRITIPAVLPVMLGAFRVSLGLALVGTTTVEFLVADRGLGHVIWQAWQTLSLDQSVAGLILVAAIGVVGFGLTNLAEHRLVRWNVP